MQRPGLIHGGATAIPERWFRQLDDVLANVTNRLRAAEEHLLRLPRGGGGAESPRPPAFTLNRAPWEGENPPTEAEVAAQKFKFRITPGIVAGAGAARPPSNMNAEFTVAANVTGGHWAWLVAAINGSGGLTMLTYDTGTTLPSPPTTSPETAPGTLYLPLGYVTTDASGIDHIYQSTRGSKNLRVEMVTTCGEVRWTVEWSALDTE